MAPIHSSTTHSSKRKFCDKKQAKSVKKKKDASSKMISGSQNGSSYCHPSSTTTGTDDQLQIDDNPSVAGEASLEKNSFKNKSENKNKSIKLTSQDEDDRQKMM